MTKRAWGMIAVVAGCVGVAGVAAAEEQGKGWGAAGEGMKLRPDAMEAAGKRMFELADADQNGQIDRQEGQSTASFLIKGLFLAADRDQDGRLDRSELDGFRSAAHQHPLLSAVLAQAALGGAEFTPLARLIGQGQDAPVSQEQLLDASNQAMGGIFERADRDGNEALSAQEIRGGIQAALLNERTFGAAFVAADVDRNGALSRSEAAQLLIIPPSDASFRAADVDRSGDLTPVQARALLHNQLRTFGVAGQQQMQHQQMQHQQMQHQQMQQQRLQQHQEMQQRLQQQQDD